ncbi:MAG: hypothetical protein KZQ83_20985 [gamma proteobacterium symbiont of Taylorina sp.]|nr:hypothetical protein [gamma proteobacterium symbiont of Taylorina sp.]
MQGGKRMGSGRKKCANHLRRELVTIRLPNWMILQLKNEGEMGCVIEYQLLRAEFINHPKDYKN